jgi:hypothetical protein
MSIFVYVVKRFTLNDTKKERESQVKPFTLFLQGLFLLFGFCPEFAPIAFPFCIRRLIGISLNLPHQGFCFITSYPPFVISVFPLPIAPRDAQPLDILAGDTLSGSPVAIQRSPIGP